jgi:ABC-type uncharacterized transport system substrate-binding protein
MRSFAISAVALSYLYAFSALAHPHVRASYQIEPFFDQGSIQSLTVNWQLDAMTSAQIRENIDLNQNGVLEDPELQAFADGNFELMKPNQFFLTLEATQQTTPVEFEVANYRAIDAGHGFQGGIHIVFTVKIKNASPHSDLKVRFFDPTWYMALQPRLMAVATAQQPSCDMELLNETRNSTLLGQQVVQLMFIQCAKGNEVRPNAQTFHATEPINGDTL